jgi:hypothetical protein
MEDTFLHDTSASNRTDPVTLKMEAVQSSTTGGNLTTTWFRNPKEDHHLINNNC